MFDVTTKKLDYVCALVCCSRSQGQHWVIAGVLVMYWAREVASMSLGSSPANAFVSLFVVGPRKK